MRLLFCIAIGYLLGSLSPSAFISKLKHKNLRDEGTGNLGATNTALVFGKLFGIIVMLFDLLKGFGAVKIAALIIPDSEWIPMLAGFFAVIGHCFPFYLKFKGGKGLASFGGVILAYSPLLFIIGISTGAIIVLITNTGAALAYYAALIFPTYVLFVCQSKFTFIVSLAISVFIMIIFLPNLKRAIRGEDYKSRDFLKSQAESKSDK